MRPITEMRQMQVSSERRQFGSAAAQQLLQAHGLDTLDRLFELGEHASARHTGRCVFSHVVQDSDNRPVRLFIKLQEGRRRLWPRMNDLKSGQVFQTLAEREWNGIRKLESLEIDVPERMGLFRSSRWSLYFRAAVVVREIRPPDSIDELISSGRWNSIPRIDQQAILDVSITALRRIHAAGLGWRGSSSRHFFPEKRPDGSWNVWLIDCEGIHRFAGSKIRNRNYEKLIRAFRESGADDATMEMLDRSIHQRRAA